MTNLISGKEALIALANGEQVERSCASLKDANEKYWTQENITNFTINDFLGKHWIFRRKPSTITINGVDVPACGTDYKPHTPMFVLNSLETCEYSRIMLDESAEIPHYWWSTEDEIKQVVAALCQVFGEV